MREIVLSDYERHLRPNAFLELEAYCVFPNDEASRSQALLLIENEHQRWKKVGAENYQPSELVKTILKSFSNASGRRYTCGQIALAMCALDNAGKSMSLVQAADVVTEFNNQENTIEFEFWQGADWNKKNVKLIGDHSEIEKAFREYRPVAHILAATVVSYSYLAPTEPFQRSMEADAFFLSTVLYFQNRLRKSKNFAKWDLWEVRYSPPYNPADYPPLQVTEEHLRRLIGPWHILNNP